MLADPRIRIVSLTVTEKGYCHDPATGKLDPNASRHRPRSRPPGRAGQRARADRARHRAAARGGHCAVHRDELRQSARQRQDGAAASSRGFAALRIAGPRRLHRAATSPSPRPWSTASCRQRPTPTAPMIAALTGLDDAWPIVTEPFTQWVIEDHFASGRPHFETRRRADGRRRRAVRADEAAHAQRQPLDARLSRLPGRLPIRERGHRRPGDPHS